MFHQDTHEVFIGGEKQELRLWFEQAEIRMAQKFIEWAVEVERVAIAENVIFGEQGEQIQRRRLWFEQLVVMT